MLWQISVLLLPSFTISAAFNTISPIPVDRFSESITETLSSNSSSSTTIRNTFPVVDIFPDIVNIIISSSVPTICFTTSAASSNPTADVLGVSSF